MKKTIILKLSILFLLACLVSCDEGVIHLGHRYEYIPYEQGHFKQYTCGCPSPEILEGHYDHDENDICDACEYTMNLSDIAKILLDYEQALRDEIDKLHAEHPEYIYYYHPVDKVYCTLILDGEASADDIVEKYDIKNLFASANVSAWNAIKKVSVIFDRNEFTEGVYRKIKQISEDEALVESLFVDMYREWSKSYMPRIEYYTDDASILEYKHAPYAVGFENSRDIIIKSKTEYDAYLDELLETAEYDYVKERIAAAKDRYDESFFEENALVFTRMVVRSSGSIKLTVNNLYISDNKVYVIIRTDKPSVGTDDIYAGCLGFVVNQSDVVNIDEVVTLE